MTVTTRRLSVGYYTVSDGQHTIHVFRQPGCKGAQWISAAAWDRNIVNDPVWTKADAVRDATALLDHYRCRCMTEDLGDGLGERVVQHGSSCHAPENLDGDALRAAWAALDVAADRA